MLRPAIEDTSGILQPIRQHIAQQQAREKGAICSEICALRLFKFIFLQSQTKGAFSVPLFLFIVHIASKD